MTVKQEEEILSSKWYAVQNDLIGGWCVNLTGKPPSMGDGGFEVADFVTETVAKHIVYLQDIHLAATALANDPVLKALLRR